jgi:dTDP-L-rhamnose 4-epimerase
VLEVAELLSSAIEAGVGARVSGKYRVGDIRHCFADITAARRLLGYEPRVVLEDGILELAGWLQGQVAEDLVEEASAELAARGLTV